MKKAILIQARMSSNRFPEKMMAEIGGKPLVHHMYDRCNESLYADTVSIITSRDKSDDKLFKYCINKKIPVYRGSLNNVLKRYIDALEFFLAL